MKIGYFGSRVLFESLISIYFMSRGRSYAEIATAENSSCTVPAIPHPIIITLILYLSVRTQASIPIPGIARNDQQTIHGCSTLL